jgi:pimeloyl-ACP methyl ester carboxylesterase
VQSGVVETEGDAIYYEVRGQGPPLLMISGGGGDAGYWTFVADILAEEYKVITYDRRGNSRSSRNHPQSFEIGQQSRDAVAVLRATGETSAFVVGNSGGAIIALDLAKAHPQIVRALVAHEPPTIRVLPDGETWRRFFARLHRMACHFGTRVAMLRFALSLKIPWRAYRAIPDEVSARLEHNLDFFMKHEMLPFTDYEPDIAAIRKNGVALSLAAGATTLAAGKYYGRTAPILAEMLGREMVTFPGHHLSYIDAPVEWAAALRHLLRP